MTGRATPPVDHRAYAIPRANSRAYGHHVAPSGVWWCGICRRIVVRGKLRRRWWEQPAGWVDVVGDIGNMPYWADRT